MFETSVVRAHAMEARGKVSLLTVSIAAHSAVVLGALVISVATVNFPRTAPDEIARMQFYGTVPPPLGTPDGGAQRSVQQPQQKPAAPPPNTVTAPPTVPETITPVDSPSTGSDIADGPSTGTEPGPIGVPWGEEHGIGDLDAPPLTNTTPPVVENKIYTVREVKAPVIIHRVEPGYPPVFLKIKLAGKAIVRCVIDKNGRVRDAQVVYATQPPFGDSVLRALKDWRYQPASLQGQAVDCYLDLTVDFGVR